MLTWWQKTKLRAGDIFGTLCKEIGIDGKLIGKINITDTKSYVALHHSVTDKILKALKSVKIQQRKYMSWVFIAI
ncbi:MAG: DbpA RNA binding domain-containing protein [Campylobacterota bacterium]|nr:DbpA RNA binding domain-containing protein [Campylobacterota bacterium]